MKSYGETEWAPRPADLERRAGVPGSLRRLSVRGGARRAYALDRARARDGRLGEHAPDRVPLARAGIGQDPRARNTELLVPRPVEAVNVTPAYLFRKVGGRQDAPTILFDEIDTIFGPKAKRDNEEIRGLLNAGHRKGAVAGRCVVKGKQIHTEEIAAYCAVALAGLGDLPDTIMTRSVVVRMRRRAPGEHVEPYRRRQHSPEGHALRDRLAAWAEASVKALAAARPDMPAGIADRDADVWEPLLAIADAAGGDWPERGSCFGCFPCFGF